MAAATYNPWSPDVHVDPYPAYRALRASDPVHFHRHAQIWFLTRHSDCAAVLRDPRFSAVLGQRRRTRHEPLPASMVAADPPEHTRLRAPCHRLFVRTALGAVQRRVAAFVQERLDELADAGGGDIINGVASPLGLAVFADLVGVRELGLERFRACTIGASGVLDPLATPDVLARAETAAAGLDLCIEDAIAAPAGDGADLVGRMLRREQGRGSLSADELVTLGGLMVIGGFEPMVHLIGNGTLSLLRHPDEAARLRAAHDDAQERTAIEELLRFDSPIQFVARGSTCDVELGGVTIRSGEAVVALLGAANHDPDVFAEPDRLDVGRSPNQHLGFGGGVHACLGAPLARCVARVAITALVRRFPQMQLAGPPRWRASHVPRGLESLPVAV
jgi:cytochrome P450